MANNIFENFKKVDCCGCSACETICGKNAITLQYDDQGFLYPNVDTLKCVNCGLCTKVCPSFDKKITKLDLCYAVKRTEIEKMQSSSSGGFAAALSEFVVSNGGVVYGVAYEPFPHVATIRVDNIKDLEKLKGSKYVQTDPSKSFHDVLIDLKSGQFVAYFGTSCHINGLLNYLQLKKVSIDSLLTIDLICHGVPSPRLFEEYISWLSKKKKVTEFDFRTKVNGWGGGSINFYPTIYYGANQECNTLKSWGYTKLFFSNNCLRPFCYNCPYAGKGRSGDFSIADYWDVEKVFPDFYSKQGVSLVFVNNIKAQHFFPKLNNIEVKLSKYGLGMERQANLIKPSPISSQYDEFWLDYKNGGIVCVLKKYAQLSFVAQIKHKLKKVLKRK